MADHSRMKLGRKAIKTDSRTLMLGDYLTPGAAAATAHGRLDQGHYRLGHDAERYPGRLHHRRRGHAIQVWTANIGNIVTLPDATIENYYEKWDGYVPGEPSTDTGGIELDVLNDWQKQGFAGHALTAFADPKPANLTEIRQSIALFGGVYIGLSLPLTAQNQNVWDVVPNGGANAKPAAGAATASTYPNTTRTALPASPGANRRP